MSFLFLIPAKKPWCKIFAFLFGLLLFIGILKPHLYPLFYEERIYTRNYMAEHWCVIHLKKKLIISLLFQAILRKKLSKPVLVKNYLGIGDYKLSHWPILRLVASIYALKSVFPPLLCIFWGYYVSYRS